MFLGMNQNMVDGFDQNSNPSLDLKKKFIFFNGRGARYAARFFVKRPVGLRSFWDLAFVYCRLSHNHNSEETLLQHKCYNYWRLYNDISKSDVKSQLSSKSDVKSELSSISDEIGATFENERIGAKNPSEITLSTPAGTPETRFNATF